MRYKNMKYLIYLFAFASLSFALDVNAVLDNQKKAAFSDTAEIQMRTSIKLPGQPIQQVEINVINAGADKSVSTIKSTMMQYKIVKNGTRIKMTDLKTGQTLPAQNIPQENALDVSAQLGTAEDYNTPVKVNDLWKISPKDITRPVLFYSQKLKRVVKMTSKLEGADATTEFSYCDNTCSLPGTLSKIVITTKLGSGEESKITVEVLSARKRSQLPISLFSVN